VKEGVRDLSERKENKGGGFESWRRERTADSGILEFSKCV